MNGDRYARRIQEASKEKNRDAAELVMKELVCDVASSLLAYQAVVGADAYEELCEFTTKVSAVIEGSLADPEVQADMEAARAEHDNPLRKWIDDVNAELDDAESALGRVWEELRGRDDDLR